MQKGAFVALSSSSSRFLVAGVAALIVYALIPSVAARTVVYCLVAALSVAAVVYGIRVRNKISSHSWWILALALSIWVASDVIYGIAESRGQEPASPSVADAGYVMGYLLIFVALVTARTENRSLLGPTDLLEAAIVTAGVGLASWVLLSDPVGGPTWDASMWFGLFYTQFDVLLLVLVVLVVFERRAASPTHWLLGGAMALMVVADYSSYVVRADGPLAVTVLNLCWLTSYVLFAVAGLRFDEPPRVVTISRSRSGSMRLALLTVAVSMTPLAMGVQLVRGVPVTYWGPAAVTGASVLVVLASLRAWSFLTVLQGQSAALRTAATTDGVTGLANRSHLGRRLSSILGSEGRDDVALLLVDLNRFSEVNQTFGYSVGDQVLVEVGRRLVATVAPGSVVGRLGGDEFAVVLAGGVDRGEAEEIARAVQRAVGSPLAVRDIHVTVECGVGIALAGVGVRSDELVQRAYAAVVEAAKRQPRLAVYDDSMDIDRVDQLRRMGELDHAIECGELELRFQPRLDLVHGRVTGLEALLRWQHPREGLLLPAAFLPSAEQTGMLPAVTAYVLDTAMAACRRWRLAGLDVDVAINLSVRDLVDTTLAGAVSSALERHGLPGSAVVFEVTETSAMMDPERSIDTLNTIRALGVSLSIDDFGTGYSSLAYLGSLPVQQLKIDRSFVTSLTTDLANLAIVQSTISLAHTMGLHIVAEGVEDEHTLFTLNNLGCDAVQGFHIARPVADADVPATVRSVEAAAGALTGSV